MLSLSQVTLDGEVMAVNGKVLAGHQQFDRQFNAGREPDAASVCSCTCYGGNFPGTTFGGLTRRKSFKRRGRHARRNLTAKVLSFLKLGNYRSGERNEADMSDDTSNFYDEENQSINNYARFRVKRSSF